MTGSPYLEELGHKCFVCDLMPIRSPSQLRRCQPASALVVRTAPAPAPVAMKKAVWRKPKLSQKISMTAKTVRSCEPPSCAHEARQPGFLPGSAEALVRCFA